MHIYSNFLNSKFTAEEMEIIKTARAIPKDPPQGQLTWLSHWRETGNGKYRSLQCAPHVKVWEASPQNEVIHAVLLQVHGCSEELPHVYTQKDGEGYGKSVMTL
jgi:hypothetical protein